MRTTVILPDGLYRAARIKAAQEGRTFTSLLEEALRSLLNDQPTGGTPYRVRPLSGADVPADLPLDDNAALRDLMDEAEVHINDHS